MSECPRCNEMRTETIRALSEKATAKNQVGQCAAYIKVLEGGAKEKDARISALEAENARLREDKERLDWLEQRGSTGTFWSAWDADKKRFVWVFGGCPNGRALDHARDNLRAVIDAAWKEWKA